jgi:hypothetical protein
MFDSYNPGHPFEESYLLAGLIYPMLPLYEDFEIDESTGEKISEGMAWGIDPIVRFRLIDRRGRQYYYCRQWARLRREDQMSTKGSSLRRKGMYAGIPKEMIEKAVWDALESMPINPDETRDVTSDDKSAFIKKYISRITIDSAGNMVIRVRLEARPEAGCYAGRWINGSTIFQKLRALTATNLEASIEFIRRPEIGDQISRLYDILLTDELEGVEL